jgi:hypothetical protein
MQSCAYHPFNQKIVLDNRSDNKVSLKWKEECMVVIIQAFWQCVLHVSEAEFCLAF